MKDLIEEYIKLAIEHGETTLSGDFKTGNKAHSRMMKIIDKIKLSESEIRKQFMNLMNHENDSVKIWTAVTLLKTCEKDALSVLKRVAEKSKDIFALNAKMTIDAWHKGMLTNIIDWNSFDEKDTKTK